MRSEFSEARLHASINQLLARPISDVADGEEQNEQGQSSNNAAEDAQGIEAENAESVEPRVMRAPKLPSREEVESHMTTHVPFRSWCKHCVRTRGRRDAHQQHKRDAQPEARIGLGHPDYCGVGSNSADEHTEAELSGQSLALVMHEHSTDRVFATVT